MLDGSLMWMSKLIGLMTRLGIERKSGKFGSQRFVSPARIGTPWAAASAQH